MRFWPRSLVSIGPVSLTLGAILFVLALFWLGVPLLDLVELKTYDLRFASRGPLPPSPTVAMAVIDEESLDAEGRWPWPRSKIAALIDTLSRDGAKVIGFDIAFAEPDENSELGFIDRLGRKVDALGITDPRLAAFIGDSKVAADNDLALANAIRDSSAAVILGYFFHMSQADLAQPFEPREIDRRLEQIGASKYPLTAYRQGAAMDAVPFIRAYAPETNLEAFSAAAASSGYFSVTSDPDGVVRWMPLVIRGGEELFPPLAVLAAWQYLGRPPLTVKAGPYGVDGIQMGERFIPSDEHGRLLINFLGPPKTFPHFSLTEVLAGRFEKGTFKDRIVLVGATAIGTHDLRSTPLSPVYPGIEIHATVIDNILTKNFLARPSWSKVYDLLAIVALAAAIGLSLARMRAIAGLAVRGRALRPLRPGRHAGRSLTGGCGSTSSTRCWRSPSPIWR